MLAEARGFIDSGRPLVIFPEGTRVPHGARPPLQSGFAGLYKLLGLPVVPVAVDSGPLYHRWWKRPRHDHAALRRADRARPAARGDRGAGPRGDQRAEFVMRTVRLLLWLALALAAVPASAQKFAELARTPPMGWNSWNHYGCEIDEALVRRTADAHGRQRHARRGLRLRQHRRLLAGRARRATASCSRTRSASLRASRRWPTMSMRAGSSSGSIRTPARRPAAAGPGSQGHEYQDALAVRALGGRLPQVRLVQHRHRRGPAQSARGLCDDARRLHAAGRPIVFSICEWGDNKPWEWAPRDRPPVAHHRRHRELLELRARPRQLDQLRASSTSSTSRRGLREIRRAGRVERSRHDGSRQPADAGREPLALRAVGDARRAADRGHRRDRHEAARSPRS